MALKVKVKWGKEKLELELDPTEDPDTFRAQLFAMTQVPPDRQKLMFKGKTVGETWEGFTLKAKMAFLLMGTANEVLAAPMDAVVFQEDLSAAQMLQANKLPPGIENQGNTCYLNSAVQCLATVPELKDNLVEYMSGVAGDAGAQVPLLQVLQASKELAAEVQQDMSLMVALTEMAANPANKAKYAGNAKVLEIQGRVEQLQKAASFSQKVQEVLTRDPDGVITASLGSVLSTMDASQSTDDVTMSMSTFIQALRKGNPQFGERDPKSGHFAQQDANEAWGYLLSCLQKCLPVFGSKDRPGTGGVSLIDQLFGIKVQYTEKCSENAEEPETVKTTDELQLSCNINKGTGYMMAGLESAFDGSVEKNSPTLGRDAVYSRKGSLMRAPGYLVVNFVRFYYKQKVQEQCKVAKDVKFPLEMDVVPLSSPELIAKLKPQRDLFEAHRNAQVEKEVNPDAAADEEAAKKQTEYEPFSFPDDPGSNNSGYYQLEAVLTHKGRSSSSGHYVAWARQPDKRDQWLCFDDDNVTPMKEDDVIGLSGRSADYHIAYILVYGPKRLPKGVTLPEPAAAETMDTQKDEAK